MKPFKTWLLTEATKTKNPDYITVKIVNGHDVRQQNSLDHVDFIGGGHHWVYKFIPESIVWLEELLPKIERKYILVHELVERLLMKYKHMAYAKAHDIATKFEKDIRQGQKSEEVFKKFIHEYFDDDADKLDSMIHSYDDFKP